jgi:predicted amidohydrolase YtcJ
VWGGDFPTAQQLDAATTDHPVALSAKSGHARWCNSRALRLAGITRDSADPIGGEIVRDASGEPNGVLLENAMGLVSAVIPEPTRQEEEEATLVAMRGMNRSGLTAVHCMDGAGGIGTFNTYLRLREQRCSTLRIGKHLPVEDIDEVIGAGLRSGFGDEWVRIIGIKVFTDGALGPKTAWMLEPYENEPHNTGIAIYDPEQLVEFVQKAHSAGLSVSTHAIGDRANRVMLDALETARSGEGETGGKWESGIAPSPLPTFSSSPRLRDRIEHAQVVHPDDFVRFGKLGLIAAVQPIHATQDMFMVDRYWGRRGQHAYAFRDLMKAGATLALGSDTPVETFDPLVGMQAAMTRQRRDGTPAGGWYPEQRLSIEAAIHGYTMGAAYAGYMEREQGSIEAGKLADLTVLSHDLTAIAPEDILNVKVERVMLGGEWIV